MTPVFGGCITEKHRDYITGDFRTGVCNPTSGCSSPGPLMVSIKGGLHAITLSAASLRKLNSCPEGLNGTCYDFTGGSVSVLTSLGGNIIFSDSLTGGVVNHDGNSFTILADLTPDPSRVVRGSVRAAYTLGPMDQDVQRLADGTATVNLDYNVPKPGTLGMLRTSLIGLVAMARQIAFSVYCLYIRIMIADYD